MLVWVVQAYASKNELGQLQDVVTLEMIANDENEAIEKAKAHIIRDFYRVSAVIEKE